MNEKAKILNLLFRCDEAIQACDEGLKISPENVLLLCNKGNALRDSDNFTDAFDCYSKVLRFHPKNEEALVGEGECLITQGKYQEAADSLMLAISRIIQIIWVQV